MNSDHSNSFSESANGGSLRDDTPVDANQPDAAADQATVEEDDPSLLDRASRSLEGGIAEGSGEAESQDLPRFSSPEADAQAASDIAASAAEAAAATPVVHVEQTGDWEHELSAHRVAVELRRIESDIRALLEERDPKRKRKLSGTHRWNELEDDILSWRFSGRFDEETLRRLQELIGRRHYLFRHLRFLASTRPTWNT